MALRVRGEACLELRELGLLGGNNLLHVHQLLLPLVHLVLRCKGAQELQGRTC